MRKHRNFIKAFIIFLFIGNFISCGVSSGEIIKSGETEDNLKVPVVTNFVVEPVKVEESDNNIIVVEINEPDVLVKLNSTYMGMSDITITDLLPGQYILDLSKKGFESQRNFINVGKNRKNYFYFEMKKSE